MKARIISLVVLFLIVGATVQILSQAKAKRDDIRKKSTESLLLDFTSKDWFGRVRPAKEELESRQGEIIPALMNLLERDEIVELENTADLIYPGAKKFYGHGGIVDYDIDRISVRAGWLLENLTFRDFGFREGVVDHDEILATVIAGKSSSYIEELKAKLKDQDSKQRTRTLAIQSAKDWWHGIKKSWKRFDTIVEALSGSDIGLQYRVFQWLRNGRTKCDGLSLESFDLEILPLVLRLSKSENTSIREEANMLIESNSKEKWWYRYKLERDFPDRYGTMELK